MKKHNTLRPVKVFNSGIYLESRNDVDVIISLVWPAAYAFVVLFVWCCGVVLWSRCLFSGRRLSCFLILCYWVRVFLVIVYMSFSYWLCLLKVVNVQCLYSVFLCPWRTACPLCFRGFIPCIRFVSRHIVKMTTVKLGFFFVFVADNNLWISRTLEQKLLQ